MYGINEKRNGDIRDKKPNGANIPNKKKIFSPKKDVNEVYKSPDKKVSQELNTMGLKKGMRKVIARANQPNTKNNVVPKCFLVK